MQVITKIKCVNKSSISKPMCLDGKGIERVSVVYLAKILARLTNEKSFIERKILPRPLTLTLTLTIIRASRMELVVSVGGSSVSVGGRSSSQS